MWPRQFFLSLLNKKDIFRFKPHRVVFRCLIGFEKALQNSIYSLLENIPNPCFFHSTIYREIFEMIFRCEAKLIVDEIRNHAAYRI